MAEDASIETFKEEINLKIVIDDSTVEVIKEIMRKENIDTLRIDYAENT